MMDDSLLEYFTCPVCFVYMNKKIYICTNGHSVCGCCQTKISKCPICKVKVDSKRNITLEKAAKRFQELKAKQDAIATGDNSGALTRKQRFSLGSALPNRMEEQFETNNIPCPVSNCRYYTKHLMQLKIHLGNFHSERLIPIKKGPSIRSEDLMTITARFDPFGTQKVCLVTITDAIFVIYIIRVNLASRISYYLNVLTVSDTTSMYKFSCKHSSQFSMFYRSQPKPQEGIEIDSNTLETERRKNCGCVHSVNIHIKKVATLQG
ncbi:unnamed protein product [Ceutorhynchus assimilis]|uniref:RING-type domain-containing protein n=1 Tax=Ceutorhynchus assimilis TaxID=467358 RepID=A0A9N9MBN9_9CUCU|nr:unnamed protein product [Ceutorhynchus assimilis]